VSLKTISIDNRTRSCTAACPRCRATFQFTQQRDEDGVHRPPIGEAMRGAGWVHAGPEGWACSAQCAKPPAPPPARARREVRCSANGCGGTTHLDFATEGELAAMLTTLGWHDRVSLREPDGSTKLYVVGWCDRLECCRAEATRLQRDPSYRETYFDGGDPRTSRMLAEKAAQHEAPPDPTPSFAKCSYRGCDGETSVPAGVDALQWFERHGWVREGGAWFCSKRCIGLRAIEPPAPLPPVTKLADASWNAINDRARRVAGKPVFDAEGHEVPIGLHELPEQGAKPRAARAR
jgi:hypothetical protein